MKILGKATALADLGRDFGATLTEAEVNYLIAQEWALTADDVLWRRSKLGLRFTQEQVASLDAYMTKAGQSLPLSGLHAHHKP